MSKDLGTDANNDLSEAMRQLSVAIDNSDKTSSPPKSLSDMPVDVIALIIKKLNYKGQQKLRKVSKSLRVLVDREPACKWIKISFLTENMVNIKYDDLLVTYKNQVDDWYFKNNDEEEEEWSDEEENESDEEEKREEEEGEYEKIIVIRDDFRKAAFDDLASALKNPKLQLEGLRIGFHGLDSYLTKNGGKDYNEIQKVLESLNHQVSVKKVVFWSSIPSGFLSILPSLKPKLLEGISLNLNINMNWSENATEMDQVAGLDQWKQAENLELWVHPFSTFDPFPTKYAAHFKRFHIMIDLYKDENFRRIKKYLPELDNFEHCTLTHWTFFVYPSFDYEFLGEPVLRSATEEVFHHPIPDSDYYLEFKTTKDSKNIEIEKKKREDN